MESQRRIWTIPAGEPFLSVLAEIILNDHLGLGIDAGSPLGLTDTTIILPTRRAARRFAEAMLAASGAEGLLLPRIRAIGTEPEDVDVLDDLIALQEVADAGHDTPIVEGAGFATFLKPVIGDVPRRLLLARLVLAWSTAGAHGGSDAPDRQPEAADAALPAQQAIRLAGELARLMDAVATEGADLSGIRELAPEHLSHHWQRTLDFLSIVTDVWPAVLVERGEIEPCHRRNAILTAEAERLARGDGGPVIVAGVTGSVPASAELMRAVLERPNGAVVLPGLDTGLDAASWTEMAENEPGHPQHGFARLLAVLGCGLDDVAPVPNRSSGGKQNRPTGNDASGKDHMATGRSALLREAMRPAATLAEWSRLPETNTAVQITEELEGLHLIEAETSDEEAAIVALILRGVAENPGQTAALVTPDRLLARRVAVKLEGYGIRVDDSAGRPLPKTAPGAFLELVAEMLNSRFSPAPLMALLKHPLCRLGCPARDVREAARLLELALFRAPYFGDGLESLQRRLDDAERAACAGEGGSSGGGRSALLPHQWVVVQDLVARLVDAFAPLEAHRVAGVPVSLAEIAACHASVAEALAATEQTVGAAADNPPQDEGAAAIEEENRLEQASAIAALVASAEIETPLASPLWTGDAGTAAAQLFSDIAHGAASAPEILPEAYGGAYRALADTVTVRPGTATHPSISIWGPFEARLQQPDLLVLGGLVDGTWPTIADPDPWLSRPMRRAVGLPPPEAQMGQAAHDFCQLAAAPQVILTRARKVDGVPTVPSRWLMRLQALLRGLDLSQHLEAGGGRPWLAWSRALADVGLHQPCEAPAPCPPVDVRPRRMSATRFTDWQANPYAIYAEFILRLRPLAPLGVRPDARDRGRLIHEALHDFASSFPVDLPGAIETELADRISSRLSDLAMHPRVAAFWAPRLARFAAWFADTEPGRRTALVRSHAEVSGRLSLAAPAGPFEVTARADRIDAYTDGQLALMDYKTSAHARQKHIESIVEAQLGIETWMLREGAFAPLPAALPVSVSHIVATGGTPPGETLDFSKLDLGLLADQAAQVVHDLVHRYDQPKEPYPALRLPDRAHLYRFDAYAHLARVAEWSLTGETDFEVGDADDD